MTLQDALDWLKEKDFFVDIIQNDYTWFTVKIFKVTDDGPEEKSRNFEGKTPLEACLKAVLEIARRKDSV